MPSRNEKVNIVIGAKDQASTVLNGVAGKVAAIGAAYLAWGTAKTIIADTIRLGSESERVWGDVAAALDRHGFAVDENSRKIQTFADSMQTLTGISDEVIGKSVQAFIDYGNTVDRSLSLARTAMDLAVGGGMDLKAATDLLAKASVGYTSTLSRYGIIIDENIPKSEKFAEAIKQIEDRFGGAAGARADQFITKIDLLTQRVGDAEEKLFTAFSDELTLTISAAADAVAVLGDNIALLSGNTADAAGQTQSLHDKLTIVGSYTRVVAQGFLSLTEIIWNAGSVAKNIIDLTLIDPMVMFGQVVAGVFEAIATRSVVRLVSAISGAAKTVITDFTDILVDIDDMRTAIDRWGLAALNAEIAMSGVKTETADADAAVKTATTTFDTFGKVIEGNYQKLWQLSAGPQSMIADHERIMQMYDEAGMAVATSWDLAEKKSSDAQAAFGQFTGNFVGLLTGLRAGTGNIWKDMFVDFKRLLLDQILRALVSSQFVQGFLGAFKFWDVAENDRALIREGNRAAMFIMRGLTDGVRRSQPAINTAVGFGGGLSMAGAGGRSQSITINFNGPITDREFIRTAVVPEIERSIRDRSSRIKMDTRLSTGVADGEFI